MSAFHTTVDVETGEHITQPRNMREHRANKRFESGQRIAEGILRGHGGSNCNCTTKAERQKHFKFVRDVEGKLVLNVAS